MGSQFVFPQTIAYMHKISKSRLHTILLKLLKRQENILN